MVKPVCPDDFSEEEMPEFIVETLNRLIRENWNKQKHCAEILLRELTDELAGKSYKFEWEDNQMDDLEQLYVAQGWFIKNESWRWTFSKH